MKIFHTLIFVVAFIGLEVSAMEKVASEHFEDCITLQEACESMAPILDKAACCAKTASQKLKRALAIKLIPHSMMHSDVNMFGLGTLVKLDVVKRITNQIIKDAIETKIQALKRNLTPRQSAQASAQDISTSVQPVQRMPHHSAADTKAMLVQLDSMPAQMKSDAEKPAEPSQVVDKLVSQSGEGLNTYKQKINERLALIQKLDFLKENDRVVLNGFAAQKERFEKLARYFTVLGYKVSHGQKLDVERLQLVMMGTGFGSAIHKLLVPANNLDLLKKITFQLRELLGIPASMPKQTKK